MNPQFRLGLLFLLIVLFPQTTHCQLVDVFPLSIGNQWTYSYYTLRVAWPGGNPGETITDSGRAVFSISGRATNADSTRWQIQVQRDFIRHHIFWYLGRDTTYPIRDSSSFELIESNLGQHQLFRNADPYAIRLDVFPFTRAFVDTTMIYRFRQVGIGDTIAFRSWLGPPLGSLFRSSFTFQRQVGLIRNSYNSGSVDVYSTNEHVLLSSIIVSVPQGVESSAPSSFDLYPNYPNPFNGQTILSFSIPHSTYATLKIYNTLGQEIAALVSDNLQPGTYTKQWNATNVASGVYYYRLQAGEFVQTRKLLLLR